MSAVIVKGLFEDAWRRTQRHANDRLSVGKLIATGHDAWAGKDEAS